MPVYQLETSITLLIAAAVSAAIFALAPSSSKEGAIKLPVSQQEGLLADNDSEPELEGEEDPFDVTTTEDWTDGYPVDEDRFWTRVSLSL